MTLVPMAVLASAWWLISAAVVRGWIGEDDAPDSLRHERAVAAQRIAMPLSIVLWIAAVISLLF